MACILLAAVAEVVLTGDDILEALESRSGDTALRELVEARRRPVAEADAERRPREVRRCMFVEKVLRGQEEEVKGRKKEKMQPRHDGSLFSDPLMAVGVGITFH